MTEKEKLDFKRFCQSITEHPRKIDEQPHSQENGHIWCEDWEFIEICKYFFNGREGYYGDPPPRRLKNNPFFNKEAIATKAEKLLKIAGSGSNALRILKGEINESLG